MTRLDGLVSAGVVSLALLAGCPSRSLPPPPEDEPKHEAAPACGKLFKDPKVRGGNGCCVVPAAGLLTSGEVVSACGVSATAYLGETREGTACRLHFQTPGNDPKQTFVMVSRVMVPAGAPAPMAPDPMLVWTWKKVPLQGAIGYQATATGNESGLLEHQTILWAGRGRRIVGLHVSKQVCNEAQAQALLQKTIDAVP
jgi:hypothetical protein